MTTFLIEMSTVKYSTVEFLQMMDKLINSVHNY